MKKLTAMAVALLLGLSCVGCSPRSFCEIPTTYEEPTTFGTEDDGCLTAAPEKPVIYLYPETRQQVAVKLDLHGQLTCTYPAYRDGWNVTADPDGTLTDDRGQQYSYLYWEGITEDRFDYSSGYCIEGEYTAAFLEDALAQLGLNRREANEFIVYWLPQMEQNPYNLIYFQQEAYTELAPLEITPTPDTLIRVFMVWQPSDVYVQMSNPNLTAPERVGFTAVEWGGTQRIGA